jgi:single-strand DNA-binding protein
MEYTNRLEISGLIATTPRQVTTEQGTEVISFRIANSTGDSTNWLTATAYGDLAKRAGEVVAKGKRVILTGELRVRDWDNGERSGTSVEIEFYDYEVVSRPQHTCNCSNCESNQ